MADDTSNVYVEIGFQATSDGSTCAEVDLELANADNIGAYNIPTIYRTTASIDTTRCVNIEHFVTLSGYLTQEEEDVQVRFVIPDSTISGVICSLVEYTKDTINVDGESDAYIELFTASTTGSGTLCQKIDFTMGQLYAFFEDLIMTYWLWPAESVAECITTNYTAGQAVEFIKDVITEIETVSANDGTICVDVDSTFAGWVLNHLPADVFATLSGSNHLNFETTVSGGTFTGYLADVFATSSGMGWIRNDILCGLIDYGYFPWETTTISGAVDGIRSTALCTISGTNYINCDVELFSLKISNFSLSIDEYTSAYDSICVDVTDDVYNVVTSGTYFIINGTVTSGTFTPIIDGYTMCYDPIDDFASLMGPTTFTVHAENDNGDSLERDYYLTYGYKVEFDNIYRTGYDFDYENKIVVRMTAENLASCPKTTTDAYWFETEGRKSKDLSAYIRVTGGINELSASIYPDSTAYFYEKEFRVVITAKDYAGNEMEPFILVYKIEDKPD
jgi:hypothetical protein